MAAPAASASTRLRRSRSTTSSPAAPCCRSGRPAATWPAVSARTGTSPSPGDRHPGRCGRPGGPGPGGRGARLPQRRLHLQRSCHLHGVPVDVAQACSEVGVKAVAVTAGYIRPEPRVEFYRHMDAANVDLKGFTEDFYRRICAGRLQPVLETLEYLKHETRVGWLSTSARTCPCTSPPSTPTGRCATVPRPRRPP